MNYIEIPQAEWREFSEHFTRRHRGRPTRIRQLDSRRLQGVAAAVVKTLPGVTRSAPLQELRESHSGGRLELMVTLGTGSDETSFLIEGIVALYSRQAGGTPQGLRIDTGDGATTLIEFAAPQHSPRDTVVTGRGA